MQRGQYHRLSRRSGWLPRESAPLPTTALASESSSRDPMLRALALAARSDGYYEPNPAVGAVLVRGGLVVGEGATQPPRQPCRSHGDRTRGVRSSAGGDTLRHARTVLSSWSHPACADAIVRAGAAARSPRSIPALGERGGSANAGGGWCARRARGAAAEALPAQSRILHLGHHESLFVTAKYAMSLDGKIATQAVSSRWVSGDEARERVGRMRAHRRRDPGKAWRPCCEMIR